ncbi:hypothetical protein [Viridibacillus arvi]|uniref:hypothetical protein n=1 Tax=Viridibacillus arvi TaxID=263475 RepID=UPI0034CE70C6
MKPKRERRYEMTNDYVEACNIHAPFSLGKTILSITWFACLPFLLMAFDETITPFFIITVTTLILDLVSKFLDPDYYYF